MLTTICAPCQMEQMGRPLATTSIRRPSAAGTRATCAATRAPASRQLGAATCSRGQLSGEAHQLARMRSGGPHRRPSLHHNQVPRGAADRPAAVQGMWPTGTLLAAFGGGQRCPVLLGSSALQLPVAGQGRYQCRIATQRTARVGAGVSHCCAGLGWPARGGAVRSA